MTCVVGLVDRGVVYIGGDSATVTETGTALALRADPKVFRLRDLLIGSSGSARQGQLMQFELKVPGRKKSDTDYAYVVRRVVSAMRKSLEVAGFEEECAANHMIGYRGRLYEIGCDFDVLRSIYPYCAIGSGGAVALGVMYATAELGWSPEARIITALEASERHNVCVAAPFTIEVLS